MSGPDIAVALSGLMVGLGIGAFLADRWNQWLVEQLKASLVLSSRLLEELRTTQTKEDSKP